MFSDYVAGVTEDELQQRVYPDTPWVKGELPGYGFLQHTFNHSTCHRGQFVTIGRAPGFTDAPHDRLQLLQYGIAKKAGSVIFGDHRDYLWAKCLHTSPRAGTLVTATSRLHPYPLCSTVFLASGPQKPGHTQTLAAPRYYQRMG
jgi:DinB family